MRIEHRLEIIEKILGVVKDGNNFFELVLVNVGESEAEAIARTEKETGRKIIDPEKAIIVQFIGPDNENM